MLNVSSTNDVLQCYFLTFSLYNPPAVYGAGILAIVLNMITAPIAVLGNITIIIAIFKTPTLHTPSNFLISNLALADFITGLLCQPLFIVYKIAEFKMKIDLLCHTRLVMDAIAYIASAMSCATLCMISVERYLALHFHLRYHQLVSIKKLLIPVVTLWVIGIVISISRFFTYDAALFTATLSSMLTIVVIITFWAYVKIFQIVKRHRCQIQSQQQLSLQAFHGGSRRRLMNKFQMARYRKSTYTMFLVLGLFLAAFGPYFVIQMAINSKSVDYTSTIKVALNVSATVIYINATINPLVYCLRIEPLRRACFKLAPFFNNDKQSELRTETGPVDFVRKQVWKYRGTSI